MRTPEQREAAKKRREARKLKKQREISGYDSAPSAGSSTVQLQKLQILSDSQIIQEMRRLPIIQSDWDENFTVENKRMFMGIVRQQLDDLLEEPKELSTMLFDAMYRVRKEGHPTYQKGNGLVQSSDDEKALKRERRKQRKMRRNLGDSMSQNTSQTKSENNPLQGAEPMVRSSHGNKLPRLKNKTGENQMKIKNLTDNKEISFKVRSKGAPKYAETGVNRPITIDGTAVNLVMNPKEENNTSKRVGFAWGDKWYIVDNQEALDYVKGLDAKKATKFEQVKREAKADKPAKAAKAPETETATAEDATPAAPKGKKAKKAAAAEAAA